MVRAVPPAYSARELAAFAGAYASDEIASRHEVTLGPDGLVIAYGPGIDGGRRFPMAAVAPDMFLVRPVAPGVAHRHLFRFERAPSGVVSAAIVTMERMKGVVLTRVA